MQPRVCDNCAVIYNTRWDWGTSETIGVFVYRYKTTLTALALGWVGMAATVNAQDLEPRRWTPLPIGTKILGAGYAYTTGDLFFDPVLQIEDAEVEVDTLALSYVQSVALFGKPVRFDLLLPWQNAYWSGQLAGQSASTERAGWADPRFRLSVNLLGAPPLAAGDFQQYMSNRETTTVLGAALAVTLPWGEYLDDRLLNLGQNRYIVRPQLGLLHTRGPWSFELTGSAFIYSDNDDFYLNSRREQDTLYAMQTHVVRIFKPGLWASVSAGYGWGGRSTIDGDAKRDERGDQLLAISMGLPVAPRQGVKFAYVRGRTGNDAGADTDTFSFAWSVRF